MRRQARLKYGFFVFSHARVRPLTYREPMRFETIAFEPHAAGVAEDAVAVSGDRLAELDAVAHRLGPAG